MTSGNPNPLGSPFSDSSVGGSPDSVGDSRGRSGSGPDSVDGNPITGYSNDNISRSRRDTVSWDSPSGRTAIPFLDSIS